MKRVFLVSPYAGEVEANIAYARRAMLDCFAHGEAAFAPHLLYTQCLNDAEPKDRQLGMTAGRVFMVICEAAVCYVDRGISSGMRGDLEFAKKSMASIEYRRLGGPTPDEVWMHLYEVPHKECSICRLGKPNAAMPCEKCGLMDGKHRTRCSLQ